MGLLTFHPLTVDPAPTPGIAYRRNPTDTYVLRFTHVFPSCAYVMKVSNDAAVRHARKPYRLPWTEFASMRKADGKSGCFGHLGLPEVMRWEPEKDTAEDRKKRLRMEAIAPLIKQFSSERNLRRSEFDTRIRARASELSASYDTVKRDLLRYYYFGLDDRALTPLPSGPKPNAARPMEIATDNGEKRRRARSGPKPILSLLLKPSEFIVQPADIVEMRRAFHEMHNHMPTATLRDCLVQYLVAYFSVSHPQDWADLAAGLTTDPVSERMFGYYTSGETLTDEEKKNASKAARAKHETGNLHSLGPAVMYEADATGGRVVIVSEPKDEDEPPIELGQPIIYIIIDRWSRFVVSAYLTLGTNSSTELRHSLMLAFGPREAPLRRFGIQASEKDWPRGQVCSVLVTDRGSDYLSRETAETVAKSLRIHHQVLRAGNPDGKGIIERFNRTVKAMMHRKLHKKGAYAKRPTTPDSRKALRQAQAEAQATYREAWAVLVDCVNEYNDKPHKALKKRANLMAVRISTPKEAYLWGLENITGRHAPRHSDDEMYQMLLDSTSAKLKRNLLVVNGNGYEPVDSLAKQEARKAPYKVGRSVSVKIDGLTQTDAYLRVGRHGRNAHFTANRATLEKLGTLATAEQELLKPHARLAVAKTTHDAHLKELLDKTQKHSAAPRKAPAVKMDGSVKKDLRAAEMAAFKQALRTPLGSLENQPSATIPREKTRVAPGKPNWHDREEAQLQASLQRARLVQSKKGA